MFSNKTIIKTGVAVAAFLFIFQTQSFGQYFWGSVQGNSVPTKGERKIIPEKYRTFSLDQHQMLAFLNNLGSLPATKEILELPTPSGATMSFRIWKTPIFMPELQAKYPMIQTFTAVSVNNPFITAKIDYTTFGFHAMVFEQGKTWIIDPYSNVADGYYISFYQNDAPSNFGTQMSCHFNNENPDTMIYSTGAPVNIIPQNETGNNIAQRPSDNIKRTYRLALSCTGEYAQAVGGTTPTKASVLSAMTTTLNRVNGIYEREFDVTLVLINQEDTLIYLNPNTDPFTANNNGNVLLGQNQTNTDAVIGNNNYGMGHIFSTGGGGVAQLGSVCSNTSKAKGVTGLANPTGDAFSVDYVSHEMGHQFGGNHSFNDCNGNEYWATAYEPGSGSTIMAYAGICGPENDIQPHSDDYFHTISLIEISNFLTSNWNSCPTTQNLTVAIPTFSSIQQNYTIPAATPFELTAPTASTGNASDSISYCWEQWDLGNLQMPEDSDAHYTLGPVFRSEYPKTNNPVRVFPDLNDLIHNQTNSPGERLPLVSRNLNFKLTVRNIQNGWGSFQISDDSLSVEVVNTGQPFKVTTPNAIGLSFKADSSLNISWDVSGTQNTTINCQTVDVYFSKDSGYTYPYTLATGIPNNGQATVQLPNVNTHAGRIKIKGHDNIFFDISDNNFTTEGATGIEDVAFKNSLKVSPNPATNEIHIGTTFPEEMQATLFNRLGQKIWQGIFKNKRTIATGAFSRGIYLLQITAPKSGTQATFKIILQ